MDVFIVEHVILHVGTQKTGTTTLQCSLAGFDDGESFFLNMTRGQHTWTLLSAFGNWDGGDISDEAKKVVYQSSFTFFQRERIENRRLLIRALNRRDRKTLILSGEGLAEQTVEVRERIVDFFRSFGCRVTVVIYIRHPQPFAASSFQQRQKGLGHQEMPSRIPIEVTRRFKFFKDLQAPDRLLVRKFDRSSLVGGDILSDFGSLFGIKLPNVEEKNLSLTLPAVQMLTQFVTTRPDFLGSFETIVKKKILTPILQKAYSGYPRMKSDWFGSVADYSEMEFLNEVGGVSFEPLAASISFDELRELFFHPAHLDTEPLERVMDLLELPLRDREPAAIIGQLYDFIRNSSLSRKALLEKIGCVDSRAERMDQSRMNDGLVPIAPILAARWALRTYHSS